MPRTYLFHGPSGCGKDTQIDLLLKNGNYEKIGTGDMFRSISDSTHPKAKMVKDLIDNGNFVPSDLVYELLEDWIKRYDNTKDWILVSVVRIPDQIPLLDNLLAKFRRKLDLFIHFTLSNEKAVERMSLRTICPVCGTTYHEKYKPEKVKGICDLDGGKLERREDDHPDAIVKRLEEYRKTINPIVQEYRNRGILQEVDAAPSIDEIHSKIQEILNQKL